MFRQLQTWLIAIATLGLVALAPLAAPAQPVLYGALGTTVTNGHLFILNQSNGSVITDVGALVDGVGNHYAITGLAYNPATNILYGSTSQQSPTAPRSLVTINRLTAQVSLIGPFNIVDGGTLSDITFQPGTGTLFGWAPLSNAIETVNLATGATTQIGTSIAGLQGGGALAFNSSGTLYAAPDALNSNTLRTVNPITGAQTIVATLSGTGGSFVNAMKFNGTTLFGNLSPASTIADLVTINTTTGVVTTLGSNGVAGMDAIEFVTPVPEPTSFLLAASAFAGTLGFMRRRRKHVLASS
jgi:PEP-CTERM motif